jgi:hypothetical protein
MTYRKRPKRQYGVRRSRSPRPFKHIRVEEYSSVEAVWKIENPMPELMERINRLRRQGFPVKKTGKTFFIGPVYRISDVQEIRRILNLETQKFAKIKSNEISEPI